MINHWQISINDGVMIVSNNLTETINQSSNVVYIQRRNKKVAESE